MTNINNISDIGQPFAVAGSKDTKKNRGSSFENALNQAIDKGQVSGMEGKATSGLNEIVSPARHIASPSETVTGRTDNLLKRLGSYSSKLEDPGVSLKSIAPILEEINSDAGKLLEETQQLTEADAGLKKIATQAVVTARTEYVKFQRGDYVS